MTIRYKYNNISEQLQYAKFHKILREELGKNKLEKIEKRIREFWKHHPKLDNGEEF